MWKGADVTARVLIIGGYGNFGSHIAKALAADPAIGLLIAGRSQARADAFAGSLDSANPAQGHALDIDGDLEDALRRLGPDIVIHTTGPFQHQDYRVAKACLACGSHYVDLADGRAFVAGIDALDAEALHADRLVVSGASSVPCLTAAAIDFFSPQFSRLDAVDYGISAAQQTNRGLATTAAVLSYVGKPFTTLRGGRMTTVRGWQDMHAVRYPLIGTRLFGNCDIPDLELFPERYPPLRDLRFGAGHELKILHVGTWALGWLVRLGVLHSLDPHSPGLLRIARSFDRFGSGRSGFHMFLSGIDREGKPKQVRFFIIAQSGHGPFIPCIPSILLARKLARGDVQKRGAVPCLDLIELEEYLSALEGLDIATFVEGSDAPLPAG
jgi:NAD(P)-dependent dehydrogenase (short-subunit alcohol dehydrogenase family)